jgi:hypothetical protein
MISYVPHGNFASISQGPDKVVRKLKAPLALEGMVKMS